MRLNTRFEYTKYKAGGGYNLVRQSENDTHRHRADGWLALADWLMFFLLIFYRQSKSDTWMAHVVLCLFLFC